MSVYEIQKGLPIPSARRGRTIYPLANMDVGDSFFAPADGKEELTRVRAAARARSQRNAGMKFVTRIAVENGVKGIRVWRLA